MLSVDQPYRRRPRPNASSQQLWAERVRVPRAVLPRVPRGLLAHCLPLLRYGPRLPAAVWSHTPLAAGPGGCRQSGLLCSSAGA